ncbi:uncharacterized protein JCM15063_005366 [Sporobolomyces koalae]|uniref:uncharacterized protein n=1 Tax=Sporobolomyces koalae TaxID=500713 RepID=UPI0031741EAF
MSDVVTTLRQPLTFTTPSFSQSRSEKGRPSSMALASSSTAPLPTPPFFAVTAHAMTEKTAATPLTPNTPSTCGLPPTPNGDADMVDAFVTPPMSRILPTQGGARSLGLLNIDTPTSNSKLPSKLGKAPSLRSPVMPLTPPLTPPYLDHAELHPAAALPPSTPTPQPTTVSGRALLHHRLHPLFESSYHLREELGSGGFGFVVRADRACDRLSVAVKFIERAKIPAHGWVKSRSWGETPGLTQAPGPKLVPMEAFVLRSIRHEGVVAFIDLFEDEKYFYLVMEHHGSPWQCPEKEVVSRSGPSDLPALAASSMQASAAQARLTESPQNQSPTSSPTLSSAPLLPASPALSPPRPAPMERRSSCDLFECIEQHSRFDNSTAKYVFAQIVEIVYALGQIGICHRDIKDENIVISNDFRVKLIDFGSAVIFDPRQPAPLYHRFHGTTSFASAEILRGETYQAPPSEVWSLGVLLSILVTGECPFSDAEAAKVGKLSRPKVRLSPEVEHLMRSCLDVDVSRRITISQIRRHPWLSSVYARRP